MAAGVTGDARLVTELGDLEQQHVVVAIESHRMHLLKVAALFALVPETVARAAPVDRLAALGGGGQRLAVHPRDHQHVLAAALLGDHRHQAGGVPFDFVEPVHRFSENLPLRGAIAFEFIGDDHPWDVLAPFEELAKELLRGLLITPALHQDIQHIAVLIHRPPQIVTLTMNGQKDFIQVPFVTRPRAAAPELIRILLAKLATPLTDGFVGDNDATDEQELFHVPVTEGEAEIEPGRVADDLTRKPVVFVEIRRGGGRHDSSTRDGCERSVHSSLEELRRRHEGSVSDLHLMGLTPPAKFVPIDEQTDHTVMHLN